MFYTGGRGQTYYQLHSQPKFDASIVFTAIASSKLCCAKHNQHAKHVKVLLSGNRARNN